MVHQKVAKKVAYLVVESDGDLALHSEYSKVVDLGGQLDSKMGEKKVVEMEEKKAVPLVVMMVVVSVVKRADYLVHR